MRIRASSGGAFSWRRVWRASLNAQPGGYSELPILLNPGDTLTFLSDGVAEARSSTGELFGFERAAALSTQPAEEIAPVAQSFGQEDDITVLTVTFTGAQGPQSTTLTNGLIAGIGDAQLASGL